MSFLWDSNDIPCNAHWMLTMVLLYRHWSGRRNHFWDRKCRLRRAKVEGGLKMHLVVRMVSVIICTSELLISSSLRWLWTCNKYIHWAGCSSPCYWPWACRWMYHEVFDVWPVHFQTYSFLPSLRASPPLTGTKLYCLVTQALGWK